MKILQNFSLSILAVVLTGCLVYSCTEVDISMPKGPKGDKGDTGLSAYEFWKEKVTDGTIEWPKNETSETDYFKFLKGKDGKDGKSAYELWKEYISSGTVPDPHNPGSVWNPSNNTLQQFWYYLTGATGENGQTPHIGENGNWWIGKTDTGVPARGKDGKPGEPGKDAVPPVVTIGENGNWFINGKDTGKPAVGKDGKSPEVAIGENGNWFIDGKDTGKPAYGKDGKPGSDGKPGTDGKKGKSAYELWKEAVEAGYNGTGPKVKNPKNPSEDWPKGKVSQADFWEYLRGTDGKDGQDGKSAYEIWKEKVLEGTITWPTDQLSEVDFFKYLKGEKGDAGNDGKSAYEIWKEEIAKGNVPNPHNPTEMWNPANNTIQQFWYYLTGAKGDAGKSAYELWKEEVATGKLEDPHNPGHYWNTSNNSLAHFWQFLRGPKGSDGIDGKDGEPGVTILVGAYNVLPVFYNGKLREYVNPSDGSVLFRVYKPTGEVAGAGVKVKGLPGCVDPNREYTTDAEGKFTVPREQLPDKRSLPERTGKATVIAGGTIYESVPNTLTPNRIHTRIVMKEAKLYGYGGLQVAYHANWTTIVFVKEREVDGTWGSYPGGLTTTKVKVAKIENHTAELSGSNLTFNTHWQRNDFIFSDSVRVIRPSIFTKYEDSYAKAEDKKFKWDNVDKYFTVVGETNFYGEAPVMPAAILVPEINGCPPLKEVKMYIKEGSTNLWGKIDTDKFKYYFDIKYPVSTALNPTLSNPAIWKPTKHEASELPADFSLRVQVTAYQSESQITTYQIRSKTKSDFLLTGAYPQENGSTHVFTYPNGNTGSFRAMRHYRYVVKDPSSGTPSYWLREPFNHVGVDETSVPKQTAPDTWGK
ncbi:hypothetical protein [Bacteroides heparinolyticus]|uniref:hypothetical protein n=1 Tax=Prevotella heparinolytica TaxID=28113 RepID=UPI00359FB9C6